MVSIALCEDLDTDAEAFRQHIDRFARSNDMDVAIRSYKNAEQFLLDFEPTETDIVFLDILMGEGMTGMQLAKEIRKKDREIPIVFLSSSPDFALEGFDVQATHYLIKPIDDEKTAKAFQRCEKILSKARKTVELTVNRLTERVLVHDILFAEVFGNRTIIHTRTGELTTYTPLSNLIDQLGDTFLRCHRSFVVNMSHIKKVSGREFVLSQNITVPIRANGRSSVLEEYQRFLSEELG